jgi:hypothetical protein
MDGIAINIVKVVKIIEGIEAIRIPEKPYTNRYLYVKNIYKNIAAHKNADSNNHSSGIHIRTVNKINGKMNINARSIFQSFC